MAKELKVIIGCDSSGYPLKRLVAEALRQDGYTIEDIGCHSDEGGFYIDAAEKVCLGVQSGAFDRGILICGTGQGMNITASKFAGIRSALCYDAFAAKMSRADNNSNVLCTGAWLMKPDDGVQMARIWLSSDYYGTNVYGLARVAEFEKLYKR